MKYYLIGFTYDHYCQGYEDADLTVLVEERSFMKACEKIIGKYKNARNFENLTLRHNEKVI